MLVFCIKPDRVGARAEWDHRTEFKVTRSKETGGIRVGTRIHRND